MTFLHVKNPFSIDTDLKLLLDFILNYYVWDISQREKCVCRVVNKTAFSFSKRQKLIFFKELIDI